MDIRYSYDQNKEINNFLRPNFEELTSKDFSISITFSAEIPPIFFDKNGNFRGRKLDMYPIDELMGVYSPETRTIKIYLQGINLAVNDLTDKIGIPNLYKNLLTIVILHEIGHYWFSNVKIDAIGYTLLNNYTINPKITNPTIVEWIAQMFTYFCIKDNSDLLKSMEELAIVQPNAYQSFKNYYALDISKFKRCVKAFQFVPSDHWKEVEFLNLVESSVSDYDKMGINDAINKATHEAQIFNDIKLYPL